MSETDLADVWARSLDGLADLQIKPHQRAWLKLTRPLGLVENTALIATPNEFVKEQLETRLRALVTHALSAELGRSIQLAVTVDPVSAADLVPPDFAPGETGRHDIGRPPGGMTYSGTAYGGPAPGGRPHDTGEQPVPASSLRPAGVPPTGRATRPTDRVGPASQSARAPATPASRPRRCAPKRTRRPFRTPCPGRAAPG